MLSSSKLVTRSLVAASLVAVFSTMAATDAEARYRGGHHRQHGGGHNRSFAPLAFGIIGGLAVGAMIANSNRGHYQEQHYYQQQQPQYGYTYQTRYNAWGEPVNVRVRCVYYDDGYCR